MPRSAIRPGGVPRDRVPLGGLVAESLEPASPDDLQSANEELRSLNERLARVIEQLADRVAELESGSADLRDLVHSAEVATLFLDREGRVRSFTSPAGDLLALERADVGRPIDELACGLHAPALPAQARRVIETALPTENEVRSECGRWFLRRIAPYRVEGGRVHGAVVTFTDITLRRAAEDSLRRVNQDLELQVAQRTALARLLQDVAVLANSPLPLEQALEATLERVCRNKAWLAGRARLVDGGRVGDHAVWHVRPALDAETVRAVIDRCSFGVGTSLVAQVLASGEPRWSSALAPRGRSNRSRAAALGLRSALGFPVTIGERVVAVLEFFSGEETVPDPRLLEVMRNIGTQVGRVIEREEMRERMMDLAVEEQRSLGEELHDTLSQQIHGLSMVAQSLAATFPPDERLRALVDGLNDTHRQIRVLASGLVPVHIEAGGLVGALREMAREWERMYGTACSFDDAAGVAPGDQRVATALYRIAREAARNAVIHGQARHIEMRLRPTPTGVELEVRDDGCGMAEVPVRGPGMGLQIMRHRADLVGGTLDISSSPETGTTVRCTIPVTTRRELGGQHGARARTDRT
jgi:two-component system CheB/CheR fusion protein